MSDIKHLKCESLTILLARSTFVPPHWSYGQNCLSRLSRMQSHVLTRALDNNLFHADRPDWTRGQSALKSLLGMLTGAIMRAIEDKFFNLQKLPEWNQTQRAMASVFGFRLPHHFFHAEPVNWLQLTELQATKAFVHFLNADGGIVRNKRIQAFVVALGSGRKQQNVALHKACATAEAPAGKGRRIDLLIEWIDAAGFERGAVVEAKFGHRITTGQLRMYKRHLRERVERPYRQSQSAPMEHPVLCVVSPRRRSDDEKALRKNKGWRWISWRSLLLAYDRALESACDDDDFRQFRRTLWDRGGG